METGKLRKLNLLSHRSKIESYGYSAFRGRNQMPINKLVIFHMENICGVSSTPKFSTNHRADEAARTATSLFGCTHRLTLTGSGPPLRRVFLKRGRVVYQGSGAGGEQAPRDLGTTSSQVFLLEKKRHGRHGTASHVGGWGRQRRNTRRLSREQSGEQ